MNEKDIKLQKISDEDLVNVIGGVASVCSWNFGMEGFQDERSVEVPLSGVFGGHFSR